jgi:flagellar biosynthesis/type III secretory pathway protein FliH
MIVRDAVLSDEPYTLISVATQAGTIRELARAAPLLKPAAPTMQGAAEFAQICEPEPPATPALTLTLATVGAWLAEQDHDVLRELPQVAIELDEIREDARTAGFNAGRVAGSAAAAQENAHRYELLKVTIEAVRADCLRQQEHLEQQCVDIVAAAIGQIAGPLLATREAAVGAVSAALGKVKAAAELTVRVNPGDVSLLEAQRAELAAVTAATALRLLPDPQVALGGCLIESSIGTLDARFELQLHGLCETLRVARARVAAP